MGFVLQRKDDGRGEKKEFNVETDIDQAINDLAEKGTKMTYKLYVEWRDKRKARKAKEAAAKKLDELKQAGIKVAKKGIKIMTGKSLFVFDPSLFQDDADAAKATELVKEIDAEENAAELNIGNKKWEEKAKAEVIEEDPEEDKQEGDETDNNKDAGTGQKTDEPKVEVDEELFDDEELPDDIE